MTFDSFTPCPTGKVRYWSRNDAKKARVQMRDRGLNAYDCPLCDFWHLGRLPARVKHGKEGRRTAANNTLEQVQRISLPKETA